MNLIPNFLLNQNSYLCIWNITKKTKVYNSVDLIK